MGRRAQLLALLVTLFVSPAVTLEAKQPVTLLGLEFPEKIAGTKIGSHRNFEATEPGLGHGIEYTAGGWKINVYIYDLKKTGIPEDPKSVVVSSQFEQARGDIFAAGERGLYKDVAIRKTFLLSDLAGRPRFQCGAFTFVHSKAGEVDSYLCLTGWQGKFVKFRMTVARDDSSESRFRLYMGAWIAHLWAGQ